MQQFSVRTKYCTPSQILVSSHQLIWCDFSSRDHVPLVTPTSDTTPQPDNEASVVNVMTLVGLISFVPLYKRALLTNQKKNKGVITPTVFTQRRKASVLMASKFR